MVVRSDFLDLWLLKYVFVNSKAITMPESNDFQVLSLTEWKEEATAGWMLLPDY